jgi:hypothetical protein
VRRFSLAVVSQRQGSATVQREAVLRLHAHAAGQPQDRGQAGYFSIQSHCSISLLLLQYILNRAFLGYFTFTP